MGPHGNLICADYRPLPNQPDRPTVIATIFVFLLIFAPLFWLLWRGRRKPKAPPRAAIAQWRWFSRRHRR